jgi:hypothetical protein
MPLILAAWTFFLAVFTGIGLLACRIFRPRQVDSETLLLRFWTGWCLTIGFLQLWHLFMPVNWLPLAILSSLSLPGWWLERRSLLAWLRSLSPKQIWMGALVALISALWVANQSLKVPLIYDTLLYHWQNTIWNSKYPLVIGLGDLHTRFAFNDSHFLYTALVDVGPLVNNSLFIANGLLAYTLVLYLFSSAAHLLKPGSSFIPHLFDALLIPTAASWVIGQYTSGYSPDWPIFALGVVIASQLLRWSYSKGGSNQDPLHLFNILLWTAAGISIKVNFAIFGGLMAVLAFALWVQKQGNFKSALQRWRILPAIGAVPAVIFLTWIFRSILLSGYPFYPSMLGGLQVPWRIPSYRIYLDLALIKALPRLPGWHWTEALYGWDWLKNWMSFQSPMFPRLLIASLLFSLAGMLTLRHAPKENRVRWLFLLPSLIAAIFWFFSGPVYRYSGALFWVFLAGAAVLFYENIRAAISPKARPYASFALVAFVFLFCSPWNTILPGLIYPKFPIPNEDEYIIKRNYSSVDVDSIKVYQPTSGELCYNHALACTPYFNNGLRLRNPENVREGFWIDPNVQTYFPAGFSGTAPVGADIIYGAHYFADENVFKIASTAHFLVYSDHEQSVTLSFTPLKLLVQDSTGSAWMTGVRLNSQSFALLDLKPGEPVTLKLPLLKGANALTFLTGSGLKDPSTTDETPVAILSPIELH